MITVENLSKRYGDHRAVDDVSFVCEPGTVTGFLGPNGAGKSTTMRMICGLAEPSGGRSSVLGVPYRALANPGRHVGVLLDAAARHPGRSGHETLTLAALLLGVERGRVRAVLDEVGLASAAHRRVGGYSFGMRQRLGIAQALLGEPRVLILDEPSSGLDPEGIHGMRRLLRDFADRGGTVLLSSHLLLEVEAVADRFVMIARGRVVAQGVKDELLRGRSGTVVRAEEPEALHRAVTGAGLTVRQAHADGGLVVDAGPADVGRAAARGGVALVELRGADDLGLEELFLSLTGAGAESGAGPSARTGDDAETTASAVGRAGR
ncbi:ATP-binding cassette domain-containing protein [Yinghuangia sp. ASG 101]|uniref:ABC transporter ATP-binding protein n=1 Tax=Yinghuangia sp. ASG 101 TaxID=2896848 RepID=UPI001E5476B1|nr:ATP-binding cassette domain-containing protein [Yinghuangia sp. ASG 101]UGQ10333.1 ATP-binding cassette domain-containing protein [Yinghuangia sp. ASG 101]